MSVLNRKKEVTLFAPKVIAKILDLHFKLSYSELSFKLNIIPLQGSSMKRIFEDESCELFSFGLKHRIPCWGFKLKEKKRPRKLIKSAIEKYNIPFHLLKSIKSGSDYITSDNVVIKNVGAYGSTMSSNYNARPFIEELLIDKEEIQIIRKKQSFDDFIKNEL